jgi:hypothetical protein
MVRGPSSLLGFAPRSRLDTRGPKLKSALMSRKLSLLNLVFLLVLLVLSGCKRSSDSTRSKPVVIEVITNAAEIAAARQAWAEQREDRLNKFLNYPDAIRSFNRESLALVREQRRRSVEALTNLRDAASKPAKVRIQAIRALKLLDVAPSADQLVQLARTDTDATIALLSELLDSDGLYPRNQPLPDPIKAFVVACVGSQEPRVRSEAAHLAAWRELREAGEPLTRLLQQQSKPDLALLRSAARLCPSAEVLRKIEPELKGGGGPLAGNGALAAVADLAEATTNAALKAAAVDLCVRYLKQQRDQPFIDGDTMTAVHAIAKALPAEKAKATLSDLVRSGKWRHMRESALAQLEEIDPASARQLAKETRLNLHARDASTNGKPKRTAEELAATCVRHGLLTQTEADAAIKASANRPKSEHEPAPSADCAEGLFHAANRFLAFDVETGECPNRHDLLLEDFAKASAGLFRPEAILERYNDPQAKSEGWTETGKGKYTVQFIMGPSLYRFEPQDLGDWYDVEAVVAAIHKALADAGISERFVALESGGQDAGFIFARPQALAAAAPELDLTLGKDLDQARKLGTAAEDRILQQLRK